MCIYGFYCLLFCYRYDAYDSINELKQNQMVTNDSETFYIEAREYCLCIK